MATWPSTIPFPKLGWTERRQQGFIRTPMDTGPAKVRRRFSAVSSEMETTVGLTAAQRATFDTFYATTLSEGSGEFTADDKVDGSTATYRFVAPPEFSHRHSNGTQTTVYEVVLRLEKLP